MRVLLVLLALQSATVIDVQSNSEVTLAVQIGDVVYTAEFSRHDLKPDSIHEGDHMQAEVKDHKLTVKSVFPQWSKGVHLAAARITLMKYETWEPDFKTKLRLGRDGESITMEMQGRIWRAANAVKYAEQLTHDDLDGRHYTAEICHVDPDVGEFASIQVFDATGNFIGYV